MAGILDSKERVMDFIITQEGRRQAGSGGLQAEYATFTDLHTFYDTSGSANLPQLAADASARIYFEAYNRHQDVVVPELEPGASMRAFRTNNFQVTGKNVIPLASGTFVTGSGGGNYKNVLTGKEIVESTLGLLGELKDNFTELRMLGTRDDFLLEHKFEVEPASQQVIANISPSSLEDGFYARARTLTLENAPNIFFDARFSQFKNFEYLPPLQGGGANQANAEMKMGNYPQLNEQPAGSQYFGANPNSITEIIGNLAVQAQSVAPVKITFPKTSQNNNLVIQLFQSNASGFDKLDCVDYGEFLDENQNKSRIVFAGKLMKDSAGAQSFVGLFTLVFSRGGTNDS